MKLFFAAQFLPYPLVEGTSINIFNRLDRLRARHDVTLFAPLRRPFDLDSLTFLRERGWTVETVSRPPGIGRFSAVRSRIKAFCSPIPMHWVMSWDETIGLDMEKQIRARAPDVVIVEHLVMTRFLPYIKRATNVPIIFWDHNVEALWEAQAARQFGFTLTGLLRRAQSGKVRRRELKMLDAFDMTIAVTDQDRLTLQQMAPAARVRFVPIGVDTAYFVPQPEAEEDDTIVFTGALNTGTTVDGIKFLVNEILPHVFRERPGARVEIVGREPAASILALADPPRVSVVRDVPDVRPYMAKAAVFVVPIRPHSGVRLKILEGFAMGKATVSTGLAADGLDIEDGAHLLIRDDARSFADAIVKLLEDKAERRRLAAAGRELVEREYSWESACAKLESHLEELLGAKVSGVG
ncbi:MAG: glycosyltransferase family 4 protein [Armatimonadota bacterium]|nr:glycosyltransferase family 4 protein [Armatimonadota bacterium]